MKHNTPITEENSRLDLKANGIWGDRFHTQVCYVRIKVRMGRTCGFEVCDEITTPSTGLSCAMIVTDVS